MQLDTSLTLNKLFAQTEEKVLKKPNIQHHNTIMASCVDCTIPDATQRRTIPVTDMAITHLMRRDNVDKSDGDEKKLFLDSFI